MSNPIKDKRYTVTKEYTGKPAPQFVVRFCGEFIASRSTYGAAVLAATNHRMIRDGALVITEQVTK